MKKYVYVNTVYEDYDADCVMFSKDYKPSDGEVIGEDTIFFDTVDEFFRELVKFYLDCGCYTENEAVKIANEKMEDMIHPVYYHPAIGEVKPKVLDFE